jgi:DNA polymerase-3 subunit alpha
MTAWLKYHYPTEFYCAVLNFVGAQKEIPSIIADAKRHGIQILRPDVNKSDANFTTENGHIRFGLKFLSGANNRASAVVGERESGFKSFKEFVQARPGKTVAEACILSGACDAYISNNPDKRNALLTAYHELSDMYDALINAEARIANTTKDDVKQKAEAAYKTLCDQWDAYALPDVKPMTLMERLNEEQKYTSIYFSGNPLDGFEIDHKEYKEIGSLEDGETVWIAAALSDEKILKTKKDALAMMSGRLTDLTGSVNCIVFPKVYEKIAANLQTVMAFQGKMTANGDEEPQFVISNVKQLPSKSKKMLVWFDDYKTVLQKVKDGSVSKSSGIEVWMAGKNSKLYRTGAYITEEYAIANNLRYSIRN